MIRLGIVTGLSTVLRNAAKSVESAGVQAERMILSSRASAEAVLQPEEKRQGVVLADIGGGTTDIAVLVDGSVCHTAVFPVASYPMSSTAVGIVLTS